ncbi:hypothetical protein WJX84_010632 [Apatococcus fuscideae]|uniref:EF-hand domain-containing protein n=1 Tax=Apatococcus fuscideae TaxID=2026836 RepID=A0AAW1RXA1_9CHLO
MLASRFPSPSLHASLHEDVSSILLWSQLLAGSRGPMFASMSLPFLTKRPQGELLPIEKLRELFDELDQHDNGRLSIADFRAGLARMGLPCSEDYLREMMNQYDEDHDGTVDFMEFQHYVHHRRRNMRAAFEEMDFHHTGTIDADDLLEDLKKAGLPARPEDAKKMIDLLDRDHDGRVSFDEFQRYICLLPAAQVVHHNVIYCWLDSSDWVDGIEYRLCMTPPKQPLQRLLAGGIAGAVSRTMVAPAERLRTLMMTDKTGAGFAMSFRQMWADGGFLGMFKGNLVTVLKTIPQSAIQFAAYDQAKDAMLTIIPRHQGAGLRQIEKALAGCTAGAVSTILTYPMELLRTRMSMSGAQSLPKTIASIVEGQGIAGFYRGFYASLLCDVLANGLGFWSYERGQEIFRNRHNGRSPSPAQKAGIGALTAVFVMTSTMPIEVVMRRLQVQGAPGHIAQYKSAMHCLQCILREEGPKAFYRGTLSSYLKVCPSIAVTYGLYAFIIQLWGIGGLRQYPHADKVEGSAEEATAAQASS